MQKSSFRSLILGGVSALPLILCAHAHAGYYGHGHDGSNGGASNTNFTGTYPGDGVHIENASGATFTYSNVTATGASASGSGETAGNGLTFINTSSSGDTTPSLTWTGGSITAGTASGVASTGYAIHADGVNLTLGAGITITGAIDLEDTNLIATELHNNSNISITGGTIDLDKSTKATAINSGTDLSITNLTGDKNTVDGDAITGRDMDIVGSTIHFMNNVEVGSTSNIKDSHIEIDGDFSIQTHLYFNHNGTDDASLTVHGDMNIDEYTSIYANSTLDFRGNFTSGNSLAINDADVNFNSGLIDVGFDACDDNSIYISGSTIRLTLGETSSGYFQNSADQDVELHDVDIILKVQKTLTNGDVVMLVDNTGTSGSNNTSDITISETVALKTLTREWTLLEGADLDSLGDDIYGRTIEANDLVLKVKVTKAGANLSDRRDSQASAFDTATSIQTSDADFVDFANALQNINDTRQLRQAVDQVRPDNGEIARRAANQASSGHGKAVSHRLATTRAGVAAGESRLSGVWAQGFGAKGSQSANDGFSGYDVSNWGMAAGGDQLVTDKVRLGVSAAFSDGLVKETGTRSGSKTEIDSLMATLYASYTGTTFHVDVAASAGLHSYEGSRRITAINATAQSDYDAAQWGLRTQVGMPVKLASMIVTPNVNLAYSHLNSDGYTESGAGAANLKVDGQSSNSVQAGAGVSLSGVAYESQSMVVRPSVSLGYAYEMADVSQEVTSRFASAGNAFVTEGADLGRHSFIFGAGLDAAIGDDTILTVAYQGEVKDNFTSHGGMANIRYNF